MNAGRAHAFILHSATHPRKPPNQPPGLFLHLHAGTSHHRMKEAWIPESPRGASHPGEPPVQIYLCRSGSVITLTTDTSGASASAVRLLQQNHRVSLVYARHTTDAQNHLLNGHAALGLSRRVGFSCASSEHVTSSGQARRRRGGQATARPAPRGAVPRIPQCGRHAHRRPLFSKYCDVCSKGGWASRAECDRPKTPLIYFPTNDILTF